MTATVSRIGGIARAPDEGEYYPSTPDNGSIEMGTVGWDGRDTHFDLGTEDNDGHTLVAVTLFRGRDLASSEHTPERCQGHKIWARMGKPARAVPEKGETVVIARPAGTDAWHIIANPGPGTTFRNGPKPGDALFEGNAGNFVRFGKDGSISFATTVDGTSQSPTIQFQMRRDGFLLLGPWGKITYDAGGFHLLHHTGARIDLGGIGGMPPPLDQLGAYCTVTAPILKLAGTIVALGPDTGLAEPAAKATSLLLVHNAIGAFAALVEAAVVAIGGTIVPPNPAAALAIAAVTTGLATLGTALTTGFFAIPSSSTTVT